MSKEQEDLIKAFMASALSSGEMNLSQIQQDVNKKFNTKLTYMEIRILASELDNVDWKKGDKNQPKPTEKETKPVDDAENATPCEENADASVNDEQQAKDDKEIGGTVVELNKLARPGFLYSGTVKFKNGATADWFLDQTGQLGLDKLVGDKPGREDIQDFQIELEKVVRKAMGA